MQRADLQACSVAQHMMPAGYLARGFLPELPTHTCYKTLLRHMGTVCDGPLLLKNAAPRLNVTSFQSLTLTARKHVHCLHTWLVGSGKGR